MWRMNWSVTWLVKKQIHSGKKEKERKGEEGSHQGRESLLEYGKVIVLIFKLMGCITLAKLRQNALLQKSCL